MQYKWYLLCFVLMIVLFQSACSASEAEVLGSENYESEVSHNQATVQDKVFEGCYFDERVYQYYEMPISESPLISFEIMISNVTGSTFDFSIEEVVMATGERKIIVPLSTAVFIEEGARAAYYSDSQTLYFMFPDEKNVYPKHIEIEGLEKLEGKSYMNNTIPGHESG